LKQHCLSIEGGLSADVCTAFSSRMMFLFSSCNLDLDPVTLVYERDLDILKMYQHLKREVSRSRFSKVCAWRVHTDRPTERSTTPHSRLAKVV